MGATNYIWTAPGTIYNGQGSKEIDVQYGASPTSGQIVTIKASNGCGTGPVKVLSGVSINFCPRLSAETNPSELNIYPNPSSENITVEWKSVQEGQASISVLDIAGRTVLNQSVDCTEGLQQTTINVSTLASGTYILKLEQENNVSNIKLVKE